MSWPKDRQPPTRPWCWNTLERLESNAWRSRKINTVRFIEFLEREDMRHGGKHNGNLKAPYEQLQAWGIGARFVCAAIDEAIHLGLVDALRPGERISSTYALTWLPLFDGTPASNRWKMYRDSELQPSPVPKSKNLPHKGKAGLPHKGKAVGPHLPHKGKAHNPKNLPSQGKDLLKRSYRDRDDSTDLEGTEAPAGLNSHADDASYRSGRLQRKQEEMLSRAVARGAA